MTFQTLIMNLVGIDNVATLKINEFSDRFSMSRLMGKSVVIGDDNPAGMVKDSSNLNSVITGDVINIEYKGKNSFTAEFSPTVIQSFNELPHFANKGGTYRRMLIIPFKQNYQGNNNNKKIKYEYLARKEVLEYVLRKALKDYSDFESYNMPKVSKDMLEDFKRENDSVQSFIDDEFRSWKVERVPVELVYHAYTRYCEHNGFYAVSSNVFTRKATYLLPEYKKVSSRLTAKHVNIIKILAKNEETSIRPDINSNYSNINKQCFIIK